MKDTNLITTTNHKPSDDLDWSIAQLRHLHKQMLNGSVKDTAQAAKGLLGPVIERLERMQNER